MPSKNVAFVSSSDKNTNTDSNKQIFKLKCNYLVLWGYTPPIGQEISKGLCPKLLCLENPFKFMYLKLQNHF